MKTFFKIIAGIFTFIILMFVLLMVMTSGISDEADSFFDAIESNDYSEAYSMLSEDFRSHTSKKHLKDYLVSHELTRVKKLSWTSRSIESGRGELSGSVTNKDGEVIPLKIVFVKNDGSWKINSIVEINTDDQVELSVSQMPSEQMLVALTQDTMMLFAESVKVQDMTKTYDSFSNLWKRQATKEEINELFKPFYQFGDALMILDTMSPQFSGIPVINESGVLIITGLYATSPNQMHFVHKYIYEGLSWKLMGLHFNVK